MSTSEKLCTPLTSVRTSPQIQGVFLDILRPVFRKDEETAWTIANSRTRSSRLPSSRVPSSRAPNRDRMSTWRPGLSIIPTSNRNSLAVADFQSSQCKRFDFEDDLILGPVYKRVLFAQLCKTPPLPEASSSDLFLSSKKSDSNPGPKIVPDDVRTGPEMRTEPVVQASCNGGSDWSPENIVRILQACGGFSISVIADLEALRSAEDRSELPKRSLPLGSILKQYDLVPAAQAFVNAKLILGATMNDADQVAQALDEGAEINALSTEGLTALQISLCESQTSIATALILLYNETKVHHRDRTGDTLLHYAMKAGNVSLIRRLVTSMDDLRIFDGEGATPLHVAAHGGTDRLISLREINRAFVGQQVCPDMVVDQEGRSALHIAAERGNTEHALELLRLGCDPSFVPKPTNRSQEVQASCSPLYLAIAAGHVHFVKSVLGECSDLVGLVKWKHHTQNTLLDCVKGSHLSQRHELAQLLISHGADWQQTWRQSDRLLEFANTGTTPKLLLILISQGCFPQQRDLDITPSLQGLLDESNEELAACILFNLHSTQLMTVGNSWRPSFYAQLGGSTDTNGGRSVFTERITLTDILEQVISGTSLPQTKDAIIGTHHEHMSETFIPEAVALHADSTALGQAYYHTDRYALNDARQYLRGGS